MSSHVWAFVASLLCPWVVVWTKVLYNVSWDPRRVVVWTKVLYNVSWDPRRCQVELTAERMSKCHNSMAASTKSLLSGKLMWGSGRLSSKRKTVTDWDQGCIGEVCTDSRKSLCKQSSEHKTLHSSQWTTSSNASKTTGMENFLKSLDKRHWITISTWDKARLKVFKITFSVNKFSLLPWRRTQPLISMRKFEDTGWWERRISRKEKFLESRSSHKGRHNSRN